MFVVLFCNFLLFDLFYFFNFVFFVRTAVPMVVGGSVSAAGGTSAAAPEFAGMISLINDQLLNAGQPPLGFLNPGIHMHTTPFRTEPMA